MSTTPVPDAMILAAIERAAPASQTLRRTNLDDPRTPGPSKTRTPSPDADRRADRRGALATSRAHGVQLWSLTTAGGRQLRRAGDVGLPESPQHQAWRAARTLAEQEIERFRLTMADALAEATALLDGRGSSESWFEVANRLRTAAWRLGSATYCLWQWSEPADDRPDIDDHTMPGDVLLGRRGACVGCRRASCIGRDLGGTRISGDDIE